MKAFAWIIGALIAGAPLAAQTGVQPPRGVSIGLFGGGAAFTDFQRAQLSSADQLTLAAGEEPVFARRIGAETSATLAGVVSFWPSRNWGLRLRGSYAPSRFEMLLADEEPAEARVEQLAPLGITTYEAQALIRLPTIKRRVMPYGIVGGGLVRYAAGSADGVPSEAQDDFEAGPITRPAATIGAGAMLATSRKGWTLNFELLDQISRTPLTLESGSSVRWTSSLAFMIGIGLAL